MDRTLKEKRIRKQLATAKGGHRRVLEARLAKLGAAPVVEAVEAPVKKKKASKKK